MKREEWGTIVRPFAEIGIHYPEPYLVWWGNSGLDFDTGCSSDVEGYKGAVVVLESHGE